MARAPLMLCYYYPPLVDVGSQRSVAFARGMTAQGWAPHVLTVKNPDRDFCLLGNAVPPPEVPHSRVCSLLNPYRPLGKLNGLLARVLGLAGVELQRNPFYDLFCVPDAFWGWIPLAIGKGLALVREKRLDTLYVSCSPFSAGLIGTGLKAATGLPLVLDFRDPFALPEVAHGHPPAFRRQMEQAIEAFLLSRTDLLVVTSEETREAYLTRYPFLEGRCFTVHNGFEAEFLPARRPAPYERFTVVFAGQFCFYRPRIAPYTDAFFGALSLLKREGRIHASDFQFLFYGEEGDREQILALAGNYGIADLVHVHPRVSRKEVLRIVTRSHLQLLRIPQPMIATKLFEAIALGIPQLAPIPEGEAARILRRYSPGSPIVTDPDPAKVAEALERTISAYRRGEVPPNDVTGFLTHYSRESLTLKLMEIMERTLPGAGRRR